MTCPQFRTTLFNNSIFCYGPQIWNGLRMSIKSMVDDMLFSQFKKFLKNDFIQQQISDIS